MLDRTDRVPGLAPHLLAALLALGSSTLLGCASDSPAPTNDAAAASNDASTPKRDTRSADISLAEQAPADFALSVTVATPDPSRDPSTLARWQRPARYIVEPGGTFRAAVRPGARVDAYPPPIRTLSRAQIESLWASVRADSWMNEPPAGSKAVSSPEVETLPPEVQRRSALVWISAQGMRRGAVVPLAAGNSESDAAARLIDQLAELAWVKK